eukprot:gene14438-17632_t
MILDKTRQKTYSLDSAILGLKVTSSTIATLTMQTDDFKNTVIDGFPKVVGLANDVAFALRFATGVTSNGLKGALVATKLVADNTTEGLEIQKSDLATRADIEIQKLGFEQELRQKLTDLEGSLYTEAAKRIEVFRRVQIVSQVSDRYRATLQKGQALLDERADFNRRTAGAGQLLRYQDMAFRVFRNDALQKYRASFDLAAKY